MSRIDLSVTAQEAADAPRSTSARASLGSHASTRSLEPSRRRSPARSAGSDEDSLTLSTKASPSTLPNRDGDRTSVRVRVRARESVSSSGELVRGCSTGAEGPRARC